MPEIIISSGVTSTGLVAGSGDVIIVEAGGALVGGVINEGGTLNATQNAILENLTAATGATVELTGSVKTSGAILKGANTNIAEGALYYMGTAITGQIADGVLTNLGGAYRICAGAGITVSDPVVGGESTVGVRVYARETATVSGGSVTTSGNVGLLGESYGNEVTVGGEGVTKATYNLFEQATADNTTVNEGGTFTVRDNTTAEGVTVNQGGQLNVSGGGVAAPVASNVTVNSDGTLRVSNGGAVSGGTVNRGGLLYVLDGEISGLTIYAKASSAAIQISGGGALMSGGTICGVATGKASAIITSGAVLRNVVLTTEATTSNSNLLWVSAGDQPAASTGSAYGYNVTVDNFARLQIYHGVFSDTKVISGGWLYLNQKGVADNTLLSGTSGGNKAHMDINCGYGGYAINTWIASGGHVNVSAGKALNTIVNSGGVLKMAVATASATIDYNPWTGTISNTVGATVESQTLDQRTYNIYYGKDDGSTGLIARYNRAENLAVETGNSALVYDGAIVSGATVADGATFAMTGGWVSGAAFGSNASVDIAGGTVIDMYMRPVTSLYVSGGALISGGILEGGYLANGNSGAVIDAASFLVENAEMRNVSITTVAAGSSAGNKLPNFIWGNLGTGGSSYDVVVDRIARFQVQSKTAVAYRTSAISGGIFRVNSGTAYDTVLSGAWEDGTKAQLHMHNANGKAYNTTVDDDAYMVISNGKAYDTEVKSGGTLAVSAGSACDTVVYAGGSMFVYGGTVSGATLRNRFFASAGTIYDFDYLAAGEAHVSKTAVVSGGTFNADADHNLDLRVRAGGTVRNVTFTTVEGNASRGLARFGWGAGDSGYGYDLTVERYAKVQVNNGTLENVRVIDGGSVWMGANAEKSLATNVYISGRNAKVSVGAGTKASGSIVNAEIHSGGSMVVSSYSDAQNVLLNSGGYLNVQADASAQLAYNPWAGTNSTGAGTITSHTVSEREFNVYWGKNDGKTGLLGRADTAYELTVEAGQSAIVYKGGTMNDLTVEKGGSLYMSSGAVVRGLVLSGGMTMNAATSTGGVNYGGSAYDVTVASGGSIYFASGNYLSNVIIASGGSINVSHFGTISNTVISNGGQIELRTNNIATSNLIGGVTLDLAGSTEMNRYMVTRNFNAITDVLVKANGSVCNASYWICSNAGVTTLGNAFQLDIGGGMVYDTNDNGTTMIYDPLHDLVYSRTRTRIGETANYDLKLETIVDTSGLDTYQGAAESLSLRGEGLNGVDTGIRWTEQNFYDSTVYLAEGLTTGNAWLEIDGTDVSGVLYGAAAGQNFTGAVNLRFMDGYIQNLAAGAAAGGSVKAVNFRMDGGELGGNAYTGGFGNVTDAANTTITGGTLAAGKNLFAGALWSKQSSATSVGEVNLTIKAGTIDGNVYGASAVKAGEIATTANTAAKHTVGDVTFTLAGGTAANAEFCAFAGGYATGTDSAKLADVYTVDSVKATISGGAWGDVDDARGGRGVFGGVFATGVKASVESVSITVSGDAEVANIFGGGWAQKGGESVVGNVNIRVEGGTVANIIGCGRRSVQSESTTSVGNVGITLAGGNITGGVYARGIVDGDAVTGDAAVTVTGATNYACHIYGFSRMSGEEDKAELTFDGYTGTFSGRINGFKEIAFAGDTAMTFSAEAEISNTAWTFDTTERTAGAVFATGTTAEFAGATVTLKLDEAAAPAAWNLFAGGESTTYGDFDVQVGGVSILTDNIELGERIAAGDYAGWGFTVEENVLKFKNLAAV